MAQESLEADLASLENDWKARYGDVVGALVVDPFDAAIRGTVLTFKQLDEVYAWANERLLDADVVALEDWTAPPPYGWATVSVVTPLFRGPSLKKLSTEALPEEGALRVLCSRGSRSVVQTPDGALGWVTADTLVAPAPPPTSSGPLGEGELVGPPPCPIDDISAAVSRYIGVRYRLGGRSMDGIDCSGLTGVVVRAVSGRLLPRHSTDQMRCGVRVSRRELAPGDLVFARMRTTRVSHVGVVLHPIAAGEDVSVAHASQRAGAVVRETADAFFAGYAFMAGRRLWGAAEERC